MISRENKDLLKALNMPYPAVALKYHVVKPEGVKHYEGDKLAFCQYVSVAQKQGGTFYTDMNDDACYGKVPLGMEEKPAVTASGQAGYDFDLYKSPAGCRKLYQEMPVLVKGTVNYIQFARVEDADFDPDLILCVCDQESADILLRATSYITGDFWESKSSPVISCAWMYAYPIISGKVNHITTGHYHGLRRRGTYPAGLMMISIPFQKIDEVFLALKEMSWTPIAFRKDEESVKELRRRMDHWQEMAAEAGCTVDLK